MHLKNLKNYLNGLVELLIYQLAEVREETFVYFKNYLQGLFEKLVAIAPWLTAQVTSRAVDQIYKMIQ